MVHTNSRGLNKQGIHAVPLLTCLGYLNQLIIAEFVQVLFHLRDSLCDRTEGEIGVDGHCRQLLSLRLRYQHVVALKRTKEQNSHDNVL